MKTIVAAIVLLLLAWTAWPYWAAYDLARAVQEGDAQELEQSVDWQSVRVGFRDDVVAILADAGGGGASGGRPNALQSLGASIAAVAGAGIVDRMLESVVNPATIAALVRQHAAAREPGSAAPRPGAATGAPAGAPAGGGGEAAVPASDAEIDFGNVRYAFFTGPTTFRVDVAEPEQPPLGLIFSFDGGWRLSRVELPVEELRALISGASPQLRERLGG